MYKCSGKKKLTAERDLTSPLHVEDAKTGDPLTATGMPSHGVMIISNRRHKNAKYPIIKGSSRSYQ